MHVCCEFGFWFRRPSQTRFCTFFADAFRVKRFLWATQTYADRWNIRIAIATAYLNLVMSTVLRMQHSCDRCSSRRKCSHYMMLTSLLLCTCIATKTTATSSATSCVAAHYTTNSLMTVKLHTVVRMALESAIHLYSPATNNTLS